MGANSPSRDAFCPACGKGLAVMVDIPERIDATGYVQLRTRYFRCQDCAQIQIVRG